MIFWPEINESQMKYVYPCELFSMKKSIQFFIMDLEKNTQKPMLMLTSDFWQSPSSF